MVLLLSQQQEVKRMMKISVSLLFWVVNFSFCASLQLYLSIRYVDFFSFHALDNTANGKVVRTDLGVKVFITKGADQNVVYWAFPLLCTRNRFFWVSLLILHVGKDCLEIITANVEKKNGSGK